MYQLTPWGSIVRSSDQSNIPSDPKNTDYQTYLDWVSQGGVPDPYVAQTPPIPDVSPRQIRQALTRLGLRAQVEAAVAAGDSDLKDWWEFSAPFERVHPQVVAMGDALGVKPEQLDNLWNLAATL